MIGTTGEMGDDAENEDDDATNDDEDIDDVTAAAKDDVDVVDVEMGTSTLIKPVGGGGGGGAVASSSKARISVT